MRNRRTNVRHPGFELEQETSDSCDDLQSDGGRLGQTVETTTKTFIYTTLDSLLVCQSTTSRFKRLSITTLQQGSRR